MSPFLACNQDTAECCWYEEGSNNQCHQGAVSPYAVDATTAEHVQTAVRFAAEHDIRLTVKATGHDFLGRSTSADSLNIWLHGMKGITYFDDWNSGCDGSESHKAMEVLGGDQWEDVYAE